MGRLTYRENTFFFQCSFDERHIAKQNGLRWSPSAKAWYTNDAAVASRLSVYAVEAAKVKLQQLSIQVTPEAFALPPPPRGLRLMPHQIEAFQFAVSRNRCYLGLDPGLGKTPLAATIARALKMPAVYICPPFLVQNTMEEFRKWAPELLTRAINQKWDDVRYPDVLIISDSILERAEVSKTCAAPRYAGGLLFVDEAHRFKNESARRTRALLGHGAKPGLVDHFSRIIYMSGTPMPNRPMELYPLLSKSAPDAIGHMKKFDFGRRYCAGHHNGFGWDFSGASNLVELRSRVVAPDGRFMLRQRKELLDLPPKIEEVFVVSDKMSPRLAKMDRSLGKAYATIEDLMKSKIAESLGTSEDELHVATYRRLLGMEKVDAAVAYIESLLDETDENILVFAYHTDVIGNLSNALKKHAPLVVTGETPVDQRHERVRYFQETKGRRLMIGNYVAMGVGFTLTKATRVLFVEFDWVPGTNQQASDRAHRIGQKNSVLVQYMCYQNSLDKAVIESLLRKQAAINYV